MFNGRLTGSIGIVGVAGTVLLTSACGVAVKQPAAGRSVAPASTAGRAGAQVQVLTGARLNALLLSGSSM
ncbi:MAG: hypothetical protein JWN00_728, partial [Actinomycetia bacterium]|nr:hypothetical protein [Actinomycetes bacterium]